MFESIYHSLPLVPIYQCIIKTWRKEIVSAHTVSSPGKTFPVPTKKIAPKQDKKRDDGGEDGEETEEGFFGPSFVVVFGRVGY